MKTLKRILHHKIFLYGMVFISVLQLLNFYKAKSLLCLGTFGLTYYIVSMSTKNKGLCLLATNIVSIFLLGCEKSDILEGFKEGINVATIKDVDKKIKNALSTTPDYNQIINLIQERHKSHLRKEHNTKKIPIKQKFNIPAPKIRNIPIQHSVATQNCDVKNEEIASIIKKYKNSTGDGWDNIYKNRKNALNEGRKYLKILESKGCNLKTLGLQFPKEELMKLENSTTAFPKINGHENDGKKFMIGPCKQKSSKRLMNLWKTETENSGWPMKDNIPGLRLIQGDGCPLYENGIEINLDRSKPTNDSEKFGGILIQ